MRLSAVLLARAIALFDVAELNPFGKVFLPDLVVVISERFRFQKFPSSPADFNQEKGLEFEDGYYEGETISNLTIYNDGIKIDTCNSTNTGKRILLSSLTWLANNHGIAYEEGMIRRWGYVSNIAFESPIALDRLGNAFSNLSNNVSAATRQAAENKQFSFNGFALDIDRSTSNPPVSPFKIERRGKSPISENKFFSASPLETHTHIAIIEQFERDLLIQQGELPS